MLQSVLQMIMSSTYFAVIFILQTMSANSFKLCIAVRLWKLQQNNNKRIISNNQQSIKPFYMGVFAVSRAFSLIHFHGTNTLSHTGLLYLYEPSRHRISPSPLLCCVSMQPLWGCEPMSQPQQWSSDMSFSPALVFPAVLPPHGSVSSSPNTWPVSFPQESKSTLPLASLSLSCVTLPCIQSYARLSFSKRHLPVFSRLACVTGSMKPSFMQSEMFFKHSFPRLSPLSHWMHWLHRLHWNCTLCFLLLPLLLLPGSPSQFLLLLLIPVKFCMSITWCLQCYSNKFTFCTPFFHFMCILLSVKWTYL